MQIISSLLIPLALFVNTGIQPVSDARPYIGVKTAAQGLIGFFDANIAKVISAMRTHSKQEAASNLPLSPLPLNNYLNSSRLVEESA